MKKITEKAFTLVELLIVIGIIGILAVTLLVALNPQEAQRKSRDAKRIKDAQTIQGVLEQWINDGNAIPAAWNAEFVVNATDTALTTGLSSGGATNGTANRGITQQACTGGASWLTVDVCNYVKQVPVDPSNSLVRTCVKGATNGDCLMVYGLEFDGAEYEILVRQESDSNADKVTGDGGDNTEWFEIYSKNTTVVTAADGD